MPATIELTPEQIAVYRATAQRYREQERSETERRRERAWRVVRRAARLLKDEFKATRVVVFGSLVHGDCFTRWSDVDLASWGIAPEDILRAMGAVLDLSDEIEVNLVDVNTCRPSLLAVIERDGVEL
jgi:predicted nucleotidyltransferase